LPQEDCDWLIARAEELPEAELVVDLESQMVATADGMWSRRFEVDPFVKYCLLNGLDDVGLTLQMEDRIAAYEQRRPEWLPKTEALLAG
ncbi:MAG: 3-isopropylmalate dehydratase small subunit, partial [Chloroflexota bacterium]